MAFGFLARVFFLLHGFCEFCLLGLLHSCILAFVAFAVFSPNSVATLGVLLVTVSRNADMKEVYTVVEQVESLSLQSEAHR